MQRQTRNEGVFVSARMSPFSHRRIEKTLPADKDIADIVSCMVIAPGHEQFAQVYVGGIFVPREKWGVVRVKAGKSVLIVFVPQHRGGGKNPLATIASLALMFVAPGIGLGLAGNMGLWGQGLWMGNLFLGAGRIIGAAISIVGGLLINALAAPPKPRAPNATAGTTEKTTQFISGAQNQANIYGAIPEVLGKKRMIPPYGMRPFTEQAGDNQYVRMLFIWGYGPLNISDIRIGDTSISDFQDVEIETKQGYASDTALTLITNQPRENQLSITLLSGVYNTQTTEANTDEISIDATFPRGLVLFSGSKKVAATVAVDYEYSVHGAGVWTSATLTVTKTQTAAFRENIRIPVSRGTYDVRLKRLTADGTSDQLFDIVEWTALRSVRNESPVNMTGLAMTAIRIRATDQLNGVINQLNGVVESIVPDWDGAAWDDTSDQTTWHATSNPASLIRRVLQGPANSRPLADDRIDLPALQEWHENCETNGFEYNNVIDAQRSVDDMLDAVASAGRARKGRPDGKWLVVEDKIRTTPLQHYTPRNTWGFSAQKVFAEQPHAWRVKFINRDKEWMEDERIVYDDGYNADGSGGMTAATKFEALDLTDGITSADQAWKHGRYHIASIRLRPESYSFNVDFENLRNTRGDLIRFNHDVTLQGLGSARIKEVLEDSSGDASGIIVDDPLPMEAGKTYNVRLRLSDGAELLKSLVTDAGYQTEISFTTPFSVEDSGIAAGNLVLFGETGSESADLVIKDIQRKSDLVATVTCVDYAPALFTADTGAIPDHDSQITIPADLKRPPAPVIASVQAGDESLIISADNSFTPAIVVTLAPPDFPVPLAPLVKLKRSDETAFSPWPFSVSNGKITLAGVEAGKFYDVQVVYQNPVGMYSAPTVSAGIEVTGGTTRPADVEDFTVNTLGGNAFLSWDAPLNLNVAYYRLKFNNATSGATWSNSVDLISKISRLATSASVPSQTGTYLIKAVGINGTESENETLIVSNIAGLAGFNAVEAVIESPTFSGVKTDTTVVSSSLELNGTLTGTYEFDNSVDLGGVYTSRLSANIVATGRDTSATVDDWPDVEAVEDWDGGVDPSLWGLQLQLRWTEDDPAGTPTWSDWQNFVIGDYTARAFEFKALLSTTLVNITPSISTLEVDVDMPDQVQGNNNLSGLSTDVAGTTVAYAAPFKATPALGLAIQNMATGDYYTLISSDETGFVIKFFNAAGIRITRTFDYVAKGYGLKQ